MKSLQCVKKTNKNFFSRKNNFFLALVISVAICMACEKETEVVGFDVSQVEKLLRGDSTKTWVLSSRSESGDDIPLSGCAVDNTLKLSLSKVDTIPNPLLYETSCGDTLWYGGWYAKNDFGASSTDSLIYLINPDTIKTADTLYVIHDTIYNTLEFVTSQFLTISRIDTTSEPAIFIKEEFFAQ